MDKKVEAIKKHTAFQHKVFWVMLVVITVIFIAAITPPTQNILNFLFETTETTEPSSGSTKEIVVNTFQSTFSIIMAVLGVGGVWMAATFYKEQARQQGRQADALYDQKEEMNKQTKIARDDRTRNEFEKIEKDYRTAVKDLTAKDPNIMLMAFTSIKQITIGYPEEFLQTTYKILIKTLHGSFGRTIKLQEEIQEFINNTKVHENVQKKFENAIQKSHFDLSYARQFKICFETIGQIRNNNEVMKVEKELDLTYLLVVAGINLGIIKNIPLLVIGHFTIENASFEGFDFCNCDFRTITFRKTNFCFNNFSRNEYFEVSEDNQDGCTKFIDSVLGTNLIKFGKEYEFLLDEKVKIIFSDIFIPKHQYKAFKEKVTDVVPSTYNILFYDNWKNTRKKPSTKVANDIWRLWDVV